MDMRIQRVLEEILFEKQEEIKKLKKQVADLEDQCSYYCNDALQTSYKLDAADELLEQERTEREYREKQVAELRGRLAALQRIVDDDFP